MAVPEALRSSARYPRSQLWASWRRSSIQIVGRGSSMASLRGPLGPAEARPFASAVPPRQAARARRTRYLGGGRALNGSCSTLHETSLQRAETENAPAGREQRPRRSACLYQPPGGCRRRFQRPALLVEGHIRVLAPSAGTASTWPFPVSTIQEGLPFIANLGTRAAASDTASRVRPAQSTSHPWSRARGPSK